MNADERKIFDKLIYTLNTYGCNIVHQFQNDSDFRSKRRKIILNGDRWTIDNFIWNTQRYMFDVVQHECENGSEEVCEQCTAIILTFASKLNYLACLRIHSIIVDVTKELWYMDNIHQRMVSVGDFDKHDPIKLYTNIKSLLLSIKATIGHMHTVMDKSDLFVHDYAKKIEK